jgi:hypothetical protein
MKQLVVWGVLGFAAYTGFSYFGVSMTHRQLEGAIENVLEQGSHKVPDATLRTKAHTAATSLEVPLEEGQILVSRERRQGERIVRVEFEVPLTWSFLGSERTSHRRVDVARSYEVDEAAEAMIASAEQAHRRHNDEYRRQTTHVRVTDESTGQSHMVDCSAIDHWAN